MKKKNIIIITSVLATLLIAIGVALYIYNLPENRANRAMDLAKSLIASENWEEAKIQLNKIIEIDETNLEAHIMLADVYMKQDDIENAIIIYKRIIDLDPERLETYAELADVYMNIGDYENAIYYLKLGSEQSKDESFDELIGDYKLRVYKSKETLFDSDDNIIEINEYYEKGGYKHTTFEDGEVNVNEYTTERVDEENGNCTIIHYTNGVKENINKYEYEDNGDYTIIHYTNGVEKYREIYEFGYNSKKITYYNSDGSPVYCNEYLYDDDGSTVKHLYYDRKTLNSKEIRLWTYTIYERDDTGKVIRTVDYMYDGSISRYEVYEYNDKNQKIKTT